MKNWGILWLLFLVISCGNQESSDYSNDQISESKAEMHEDLEMESVQSGDWVDEYPEENLLVQNNNQTPPSLPQKENQTATKQPRIIKTANINLEIADYEEDDRRIRELIKMMDGYISSEEQTNQYYKKSNTLIVRIAPPKLDNFLHELKKIGKKVVNASVSSKDVTKEFVDIEIRIQSKTEVIERYRGLLKQAKTVAEILQVENELRVVVEELEAVKGRLNYLKNRVGLSTVTIHFFQNIDQPDQDRPGFFANLGEAIDDGWQGLKYFIVGMVSIWPFLIMIAISIYFLRKYLRRRRDGSK